MLEVGVAAGRGPRARAAHPGQSARGSDAAQGRPEAVPGDAVAGRPPGAPARDAVGPRAAQAVSQDPGPQEGEGLGALRHRLRRGADGRGRDARMVRHPLDRRRDGDPRRPPQDGDLDRQDALRAAHVAAVPATPQDRAVARPAPGLRLRDPLAREAARASAAGGDRSARTSSPISRRAASTCPRVGGRIGSGTRWRPQAPRAVGKDEAAKALGHSPQVLSGVYDHVEADRVNEVGEAVERFRRGRGRSNPSPATSSGSGGGGPSSPPPA